MLKFFGIVTVDRPFESKQSKAGKMYYSGNVGFQSGKYTNYVKAVSFGNSFSETGTYFVEGRIDKNKMGVSLVILDAVRIGELDTTM